MWPLILAAAALFFAILAVFFSWRAARYAVEHSASSVSLQKLALIEAEMADTRSMIEGIRSSLHKLRSRERMRDRNGSGGDKLPEDREALKRALRDKVGLTGVPHLDAKRK